MVEWGDVRCISWWTTAKKKLAKKVRTPLIPSRILWKGFKSRTERYKRESRHTIPEFRQDLDSLKLIDQQHRRRRFPGAMHLFLHLISLISHSLYSPRALSIVWTSPWDALVCREVRRRGHPVDKAWIVLQRQYGTWDGFASVKFLFDY